MDDVFEVRLDRLPKDSVVTREIMEEALDLLEKDNEIEPFYVTADGPAHAAGSVRFYRRLRRTAPEDR